MNFKKDFGMLLDAQDYTMRFWQAVAAAAGTLLLTGDSGHENAFVRPVI